MDTSAITAVMAKAKEMNTGKSGGDGSPGDLFALLLENLQGSDLAGKDGMLADLLDDQGDFKGKMEKLQEKIPGLSRDEKEEELAAFMKDFSVSWIMEALQLLEGLYQEGKADGSLNMQGQETQSNGKSAVKSLLAQIPAELQGEEAAAAKDQGALTGENRELLQLFTEIVEEFKALAEKNPALENALSGENAPAAQKGKEAGGMPLLNALAGDAEAAELSLFDKTSLGNSSGETLSEGEKNLLNMLTNAARKARASDAFSLLEQQGSEKQEALKALQGMIPGEKGDLTAEKIPAVLQEKLQGSFSGAVGEEDSSNTSMRPGLFSPDKGSGSISGESVTFPGAEITPSNSEEGGRGLTSFLSKVEKFFHVLFSGGESSTAGKNLNADTAPRGMENMGQLLWGQQTNNTQVANAPMQESQPGSQFNMQEVISQVVERVSYLKRSGSEELKVKLHPETLGEVLIRMRRTKGTLSAEIIAQNKNVKELLESNMDALRQRFQQMDLNIEEFTISLNDEENSGNGFWSQERQQQELFMASRNSFSGGKAVNEEYVPPPPSPGESRVDYLV